MSSFQPGGGWPFTQRFAFGWVALAAALWLWFPSSSAAQEPAQTTDTDLESEAVDTAAPTTGGADEIDLPSDDEGFEPEFDAGHLDPSIEEIIVTSQGRQQSLQEISVSVAAFNSDYLEALGADNIGDIAQFTPNLEIRSVFAASNPTLFIRGVGLRDFNANSASSVAVYNDDVYMNSPAGQLAQLFDIEQIEVLRGPQGTLYGRNASAGAIRIIARKPTGEPGGFIRTSYGRFNEIEIEGATEFTMLPDMVHLRVSGTMQKRDGTAKNRCADSEFWRGYSRTNRTSRQSLVFAQCFNTDAVLPKSLGGQGWYAGPVMFGPFPGAGSAQVNALDAIVPDDIEKKVNDIDRWAGRALLLFQPTSDMDWTLNVHGGQNRSQARQFQTVGRRVEGLTNQLSKPRPDVSGYQDPDNVLAVAPVVRADYPDQGDPFEGDYNRTGPENLDLFGANLTGEIQLGDLKIKTVTAYEWNDRFVAANVDSNPYSRLEIDFGSSAWQASEEVRGFWDSGGDFTAQGGMVFLYEDLDSDNKFRVAPQLASYQKFTQKTYAGSVYSYLTWDPNELVTIEGGLRWNIDHKSFDLVTGTGPGAPGSRPNPLTLVYDSTSVTKNGLTGDISLNYQPIDDVNMYVKYSRGWKGPHINGGALGEGQSASDQPLITPVSPEKVNALEIGVKSTLFDSRVHFTTAAFYYDYQDIQIFQLKNAEGGVPVQELISANDADVYGIEVEMEARPLEGWVSEQLEGLLVFMSFAWLDSKYTDFVNTKINFTGDQPVPFTENLSGNSLINAPRYAFTGYVQWDFPMWGWGNVVPRFDWAFKDKVFFSPQNLDEVSQGSLWLLNARLSYTTPNEMVEIAGWVRNIADEVYWVDAINLSEFQEAVLYAVGDPRTYGISVTIRF